MNKKFLPGEILFIITFVLSNLASVTQVKAQNANTFYGDSAGVSITTGDNNSGFGFAALSEDATGNLNTACGAPSLSFNNGDYNTATGAGTGESTRGFARAGFIECDALHRAKLPNHQGALRAVPNDNDHEYQPDCRSRR